MAGRIDRLTEQRIKSAAEIVGVVGSFVRLKKSGAEYDGLCPFHQDRHLGSFKVNPRRNLCRCFTCGKTWWPVDFVMAAGGMTYPEALRWLADKYGISVDEERDGAMGRAKMARATQPTLVPRQEIPELPVLELDKDMVAKRLDASGNPLLGWMRGLPWSDEERSMLETVLTRFHFVGTGRGKNDGWTIWWYFDETFCLRTGKIMAYTADGHRDKSKRADGRDAYTRDWVHAKLRRAGRWSEDKERVEIPLYGLHLLDIFPEAEVCIVESEKTAVLCQAISNPDEKIWMATGSKGSLSARQLKPIMDRGRWIVLYPDVDGLEEWQQRAAKIDYDKIMVTSRVSQMYNPELDSPKADIADIIVRMLCGKKAERSMYEKLCDRLGLTRHVEGLEELIEKLDMKLI